MKNVYIGTSGYNYKDWKGRFYPEDLSQKKWLAYFSQHFKTVEINATFYGSFRRQTFENWCRQVPDDFTFVLKGSRFVTHIKRIKGFEESIKRFFSEAEGLGNKLSCVLWQFPSNFKLHKDRKEKLERLESFLKLLPTNIRQSVEFRDESWFAADVFVLLQKYNTALVINCAKSMPYYEAMPADFTYIRFHGPEALYSSKYSKEDMEYWAGKIKGYLKSRDVYVYFNNDFYGYAIDNARELIQFLSSNS